MTGRRKGTPCACETDPCSCGSSKGKCIRTINNLSPDPNGDFFIEEGSGITITQTGDNSFEVSFDGTLPSNPLIYKGTVGSGGTVAVLPAADPDNIGWTYIAIEAATSPVTYEVGDVLISDGYTWQVVPSGDEIVPIVTAWQLTPDDQHVPSEKLVKDSLDAKLDKITTGINPRVYAHTASYQHDIQCASAASTGTVMLRDANARAYGDNPANNTDLLCLVNVNTLNNRLTDGSVSKIGTVNVGSDTKPIKLVAGVPTPVTNDLVDVASTQRIQGEKNYDSNKLGEKDDEVAVFSMIPASHRQNVILKAIDMNNDWFVREEHWAYSGGSSVYNRAVRKQISGVTYTNEFKQNINNNGTTYLTGPSRTYNASNTTDIVNIALLDAYTPMVRTTGNQTIGGTKDFTGRISVNRSGINPGIQLKRNDVTRGNETVNKGMTYIEWVDSTDSQCGYINCTILPNGTTRIGISVKNSDGSNKDLILLAGDVI